MQRLCEAPLLSSPVDRTYAHPIKKPFRLGRVDNVIGRRSHIHTIGVLNLCGMRQRPDADRRLPLHQEFLPRSSY